MVSTPVPGTGVLTWRPARAGARPDTAKPAGMATAAIHLDRATALARRREAARARGKRRLAVLLAGLAAVVCAAGYVVIAHSSVFAVNDVRVSGGSPALDAQVQRVAAGAAGHGSLLELNPAAIARRIEQIPFVLSARVDRAFPNTLSISILRDMPVAQLRICHADYLVGSDGRVLEQTTARHPGVPLIQLPSKTPVPTVGRVAADASSQAALSVMAARPAGALRMLGPLTRVYSSTGMVILAFAHHIQLRMGTPDQAALKWRAAIRDLGRMPASELAGVAYLDLSGFPRLAIGERS